MFLTLDTNLGDFYAHFAKRSDVSACVGVLHFALTVCMLYSKISISGPLCKARRGALPRVLRLQYPQSPPNVWLSYTLACPPALRA
jgi:hypothetical protein